MARISEVGHRRRFGEKSSRLAFPGLAFLGFLRALLHALRSHFLDRLADFFGLRDGGFEAGIGAVLGD